MLAMDSLLLLALLGSVLASSHAFPSSPPPPPAPSPPPSSAKLVITGAKYSCPLREAVEGLFIMEMGAAEARGEWSDRFNYDSEAVSNRQSVWGGLGKRKNGGGSNKRR